MCCSVKPVIPSSTLTRSVKAASLTPLMLSVGAWGTTMGSDTARRGVRFSIRSFLGGGVYVNELGFCRSFFVGLLPISVSVPPLCNADGHHLRHYKRNQRMHHRSGCCLSVAGSVESLSHNSNLVGRGRRYRDHSVQMCIADLNLGRGVTRAPPT